MKKETGGAAFPIIDAQMIHRIGAAALEKMNDASGEERDRVYLQAIAQAAMGMTLRDYFASHETSQPDTNFMDDYARRVAGDGGIGRRPLSSLERIKMVCEWRYACADAMLLERAK